MKMNERLRSIKGIVWDLDNTLYRTEEAVLHAFNVAVARTAIALGAPLTLDEATKLARKSFEETGYSGRCFIERYGIDPRKVHFESHGFIDEKIIERSAEISALFGKVEADHALLTHGARDWAMRVLLHLDLLHWFPHERIHGLEDYDFHSKALSAKPFERALESLNANPKEAVIVEDTLENLRIPHDMGMMTVYLSHGRATEGLPAYVGMVCANAGEFLETVVAAKSL